MAIGKLIKSGYKKNGYACGKCGTMHSILKKGDQDFICIDCGEHNFRTLEDVPEDLKPCVITRYPEPEVKEEIPEFKHIEGRTDEKGHELFDCPYCGAENWFSKNFAESINYIDRSTVCCGNKAVIPNVWDKEPEIPEELKPEEYKPVLVESFPQQTTEIKLFHCGDCGANHFETRDRAKSTGFKFTCQTCETVNIIPDVWDKETDWMGLPKPSEFGQFCRRVEDEFVKRFNIPQELMEEPLTQYEKFYKEIDKACEHMKKLLRSKNKGYATTGENDPLANFRWKTETTLAVYLNSKMSRLKGWVHTGSKSYTDLHEIFRDIAGYSLIGMAYLYHEYGFVIEED